MGIRKFIARFVLFTFVLVSILVGLRFFLITQLNYTPYPQETLRVENLEAQLSEIEALTIGNSHAQSIDFTTLEIEKGYHIWGPGQDLYETKAALEKLIPKAKKLRTVFIPIDRLWTIDNHEFQEKRIRFYSMHPDINPLPNDLDNWIRARIYFFNKFNFQKVNNKWFVLGKDGSKRNKKRFKESTNAELIATVAELIEIHQTEIHQSNKDSLAEQEATNALIEIAALLKANNIRMICFNTNVHPSYINHLEQNGLFKNDGYKKAMQQLQKSHGVEFYDFYGASEKLINAKSYYNSDHLNLGVGAPIFSANLLEQINAHAPLH